MPIPYIMRPFLSRIYSSLGAEFSPHREGAEKVLVVAGDDHLFAVGDRAVADTGNEVIGFLLWILDLRELQKRDDLLDKRELISGSSGVGGLDDLSGNELELLAGVSRRRGQSPCVDVLAPGGVSVITPCRLASSESPWRWYVLIRVQNGIKPGLELSTEESRWGALAPQLAWKNDNKKKQPVHRRGPLCEAGDRKAVG